ncbi:hypothetical protein E1180_21260 [Roseibium denhamense]|uniref:Type VI secretion system protein ImpA n=1 Tax=Roseibium denhamense TaxID=76305 RepID=A0ABY1NTQ4_9HYPH|nr:type VI secretion system ImpA family N-terminal domain-containing protein [Roseibium denhamense]MTI08033.1 hypothetical protein [Roseibium denhamense]SMP15670.1 type VI secretion system protein ImpA [Roseibium denhamense]
MELDPNIYGMEIAPGAGCGPDLYDTDPAFAALMDSCEEMLPERFGDFDRSEIDFPDLFKQMDGFLKQSRDLRLLVFLGQFALLSGNLHLFANTVRTIGTLLDAHWDAVHPADGDFNFMERMGALEGLNSRPTVLLPLAAAPLFKTRRSGPVSYRAVQVAAGHETARPDEHVISLGAIEAALTSGELEQESIDRLLEDLSALPEVLAGICQTCSSKLSEASASSNPPDYSPLIQLLKDMGQELNLRLGRATGDTGEAEPDGGKAEHTAPAAAETTGSSQELKNAAQAKCLLEQVENYFASREPSHPALFLVRESRGLVGKTYLDALKILMPRRFDDVSLILGTSGLQLSNDRLVDLNDSGTGDLGDMDGFEPPQITNRTEAMRGIGAVKAYYAANEPTSPIPLLLDEAQTMSSGSFTGLLNLFLRPEEE